MGAIAEAIVAYAQPLLDATDGSMDDMNRAMDIAQVCWNLAILPEEQRDTAIDELKPTLKMTDEEFVEFRQQLIFPMIRRHREMFPNMRPGSRHPSSPVGVAPSPTEKHEGTGRNAPCPCGSGRKYKRCCGSRK